MTYRNSSTLTMDKTHVNIIISGMLGKYCGTPGLAEPEGDCDPGYYCLRGNKAPNPQGLDIFFDLIDTIMMSCLNDIFVSGLFHYIFSTFSKDRQ